MDRCDGNGRILTKPPPGYGGPLMEMGNSEMDAENGRRVLGELKNIVNVGAKRGFSGKISEDERNPPACIARRPITRSFAATLKSNICSQKVTIGNEENIRPISNPLSVDSDLNLPMEEEVEAALCEFREVEMVDAVAEQVMDIDSEDINDPLSTAEYVDDIYRFYREIEDTACVSPTYMSNQLDINEKMRAILIDWLIEVHYKFELMDETLFLTVNIIDRFLASHPVIRKKLQLVGVVAMLLACKYEEVCVPVIEDLILISDRAYTRSEVLDMEKIMLNTLEFNLSVPTPYVFLRRALKASGSDKKVELLSFYIIELCLVEYEMLRFHPSLLAAAAVYAAQCAIKGFKHWTKTSEVYSHYTEERLMECSLRMVDIHQKAASGKLTGVHRKFSTLRFERAARYEPALFLLDAAVLQ